MNHVDTNSWVVIRFYSDGEPDVEHYGSSRESCEAWMRHNVKAPISGIYAIAKINTVVRSELVWSKVEERGPVAYVGG